MMLYFAGSNLERAALSLVASAAPEPPPTMTISILRDIDTEEFEMRREKRTEVRTKYALEGVGDGL